MRENTDVVHENRATKKVRRIAQVTEILCLIHMISLIPSALHGDGLKRLSWVYLPCGGHLPPRPSVYMSTTIILPVCCMACGAERGAIRTLLLLLLL